MKKGSEPQIRETWLSILTYRGHLTPLYLEPAHNMRGGITVYRLSRYKTRPLSYQQVGRRCAWSYPDYEDSSVIPPPGTPVGKVSLRVGDIVRKPGVKWTSLIRTTKQSLVATMT